MELSLIDVLIGLPLIPLAPVIVTWYLPWEKWIPRYVSKSVLGPYFLYASFAAWHFKVRWWIILLALALGASLSIAAVVQRVGKAKNNASQ